MEAAASEESNLSYIYDGKEYNFKEGEPLLFSDSWNDHSVKTKGILKRVAGGWQIHYTDRGIPKIEKLKILTLRNGNTKLYKYTPPAEMPRFTPKLTSENHAYRKMLGEHGHPSYSMGGSKKRTRRRKIKKSRSMKKFRK